MMRARHELESLGALFEDNPGISYTGISGIRSVSRNVGHMHYTRTSSHTYVDYDIFKADQLPILGFISGVVEYDEWRSDSRCYYCFFQFRDQRHRPAECLSNLLDGANAYQKIDAKWRKRFARIRGKTLDKGQSVRREIKQPANDKLRLAVARGQQSILAKGQACPSP